MIGRGGEQKFKTCGCTPATWTFVQFGMSSWPRAGLETLSGSGRLLSLTLAKTSQHQVDILYFTTSTTLATRCRYCTVWPSSYTQLTLQTRP